ncbi:MAG: TetR/AcrR family transcriptional regulator [Propionicimonas sp.]
MTAALSVRQVAKREQIAKAARKLFLELGYAGTSMDAVSAQAGVSKQTLYTYFPTKVDLLQAILTHELVGIQAGAGAPPTLASVADLREVLLRFAHRFTRSLLHPDALAMVRLVMGEAFRIPEVRETVRDAVPVRALHGIAAILARADELGLITAPDPDLAARMLLGPIMTYVAIDGFLQTDAVTPPSAAKLERIVDYFLAMVRVLP